MQGAISAARPAAALAMKASSASQGRAIDTMSATPWANSPSATSGLLIRFEVMTGIVTSGRRRAVRSAKAARGTEVAMVGTRASCQPMPVFRTEAPAVSMAFARVTTSSQVEPLGIRSISEMR